MLIRLKEYPKLCNRVANIAYVSVQMPKINWAGTIPNVAAKLHGTKPRNSWRHSGDECSPTGVHGVGDMHLTRLNLIPIYCDGLTECPLDFRWLWVWAAVCFTQTRINFVKKRGTSAAIIFKVYFDYVLYKNIVFEGNLTFLIFRTKLWFMAKIRPY